MISVENALKPVKNFNIFSKTKLFNYQDVINIIITVIGIVISSIEIFELQKIFHISNFRFILYNSIMCIIIIVLNIYQIINRRKIVKERIYNKQIEERNKNLLEITDNIRCFKHDFNNIMQAINGYLDVKDINALQKYFNCVIKECNHINLVEILDSQVMDNPAIYSVLSNKYQQAKENNITIYFYPHQHMQKFLKFFKTNNENIKLFHERIFLFYI